MFCPSCLSPNEPRTRQCTHCQAEIEGLRRQVSVGAQFLFADASPRRPVALSLDGQPPQRFTRPTLISRHRHDIGLGEISKWRPQTHDQTAAPPIDVPRLPPPDGPHLATVITERRIYRPRDEVHAFIIAPHAPDAEVEIETQLAGQQITRRQVTLDAAGLALCPYTPVEEGEYTVVVRVPSRRHSGSSYSVQCTFSVAEFALSPLVARLEGHTYHAGELGFRLNVVALSVPYDGPVELALHSGPLAAGRVVHSQQAEVRQGALEAILDVHDYDGPFRVQLTTPGGETATVFIPGTGRDERERVTLCPLGTVAEAGLLPDKGTTEVRGLYVGYDDIENTPLRLESAIAHTARLVVDVRAALVQVVIFHPLTGETAIHEWRDVSPGEAVEFPVETPYTFFTAGLLAPRQPYEAWGVVVRPAGVVASLHAPAHTRPGAEIAVRVESDWPGKCLLLVYDARLEHESPLPRLGKQLLEAIRSATADLREQTAPALASIPPWGWTDVPDYPNAVLRSMVPSPGAVTRPGLGKAMAAHLRPSSAGIGTALVEAEMPTFVAAPGREDFPELAYLELFPVDHVVERTVALGDQIGTWRCRAYLVSGLDLLELSADVEAAKPVYAELDLPAIVGHGDDVLAAIHYHTPSPATMTITLPGGGTTSGVVMGHGAERIHLTAPGEVTVRISGQAGDDWTARTIPPPGVQTVTASRLEILKKGQTIRANRVVVYPGPADVLQETIEALGRYPFG